MMQSKRIPIDTVTMYLRIKKIIADETGIKRISDKALALELGYTSSGSLASVKHRGLIPFEKIVDFCARKNILANWIFYGQKTDEVLSGTKRSAVNRKPANNA
jgi:hypothetical protein